ncbi:BQ2448_4950 [Microbotryum intermedium]|uniref:BQ2448_4950 protein n=1 Tax=Microbotryum intermedium TaxID=269621 RepID=A0A238FME6_9BASI|nr:BQ2448_4950 [Microbotryum intermedium]
MRAETIVSLRLSLGLLSLLPCRATATATATSTPAPLLNYQIPSPERIAQLAQPYLINPQSYSKTVYYRQGPQDDVSGYIMYAFLSPTGTGQWASAVVRHTYGYHYKNSNFEPTTTDIALSRKRMVPVPTLVEGPIEYAKNRKLYKREFLWNQPRSAILGDEEKLRLGTLAELSKIDPASQPILSVSQSPWVSLEGIYLTSWRRMVRQEYSEDMAEELGEGCP